MNLLHRTGHGLLAFLVAATLAATDTAHAGRVYGATVTRGYAGRGGVAASRTTVVRGPAGNTAVRRTTVVAGNRGYSGGAVAAAAVGGAVVGATIANNRNPTVVVTPLPSGYYATIPPGYTVVTYGGYQCYYVGGVYYRPVIYGGNTTYIIVH